ncbi:MAG TPA: divergent PAP2 family protein [Patescibacteria group bacterium]|nr:divergent PAP2 family protein [Patescibacteria group bacterium]
MKYLLLPIIVSLIVQAVKVILDLIKKRFSWHRTLGYGGMPSSHSALVCSLAAMVYLLDGLNVAFFISAVLAIVVMRDAIGLRGYLTMHGKVLNRLIKDLPDEKEYKYPVLEETIAHSFLQILIGGILGVVLTLLFF